MVAAFTRSSSLWSGFCISFYKQELRLKLASGLIAVVFDKGEPLFKHYPAHLVGFTNSYKYSFKHLVKVYINS